MSWLAVRKDSQCPEKANGSWLIFYATFKAQVQRIKWVSCFTDFQAMSLYYVVINSHWMNSELCQQVQWPSLLHFQIWANLPKTSSTKALVSPQILSRTFGVIWVLSDYLTFSTSFLFRLWRSEAGCQDQVSEWCGKCFSMMSTCLCLHCLILGMSQ